MGFLGKLFGKKDEEAAVELSSAVTQQPVYEEKLQTIDISTMKILAKYLLICLREARLI